MATVNAIAFPVGHFLSIGKYKSLPHVTCCNFSCLPNFGVANPKESAFFH